MTLSIHHRQGLFTFCLGGGAVGPLTPPSLGSILWAGRLGMIFVVPLVFIQKQTQKAQESIELGIAIVALSECPLSDWILVPQQGPK